MQAPMDEVKRAAWKKVSSTFKGRHPSDIAQSVFEKTWRLAYQAGLEEAERQRFEKELDTQP